MSLPLAHKLLCFSFLFLYVLYSLYTGMSVTHKSLYKLYNAYALYSLNVGLSLAHTQMPHLCIKYYNVCTL